VKNRNKVHLVLGSGGARGITQIGIIEVLNEAGFEIISVTGSSIGAAVGGMYAAGFLPVFKKWLLGQKKSDLFKLVDLTLTRHGFVKGEKIREILQALTGNPHIEELSIPFTAVASDMLNNREVIYNSGDFYKAIRASIGIPGIFTPIFEHGQFLIDGGILNPLPVNLVKKNSRRELVVAVNLNAHPVIEKKAESIEKAVDEAEGWSWLKLFNPDDKPKAETTTSLNDISLHELLFSSYQMTQNRLTDLMLQMYPPDILINIPINTCSIFDFFIGEPLVKLGREKAEEAITKYRAKLLTDGYGFWHWRLRNNYRIN
jgi:NTE family protein